MKHPFHSRILPWFPLGAGAAGLVLRFWLFSAVDQKGLLPANHFADTALYLLTALTLGILFLSTRQLQPGKLSKSAFRYIGAFSCLIGACGLGYTGMIHFFTGTVRLSAVAAVASMLGALALLIMALLHYAHLKVPYWLNTIVTVILMLDTVAQCQVWGAVPQLQEYFFPLLASIFLILTAYQATALSAGKGKPTRLAFFSQSAVFLCFVSLNTAQRPLYLGLLFWAGAQLYPCIRAKKEA